MNKIHHQTLALASLLQAATLVHQLASTGTCDSKNNKASLNSIVNNSTNIDEIFGSVEELSTGVNSLKSVFGKKSKSAQNIIFYVLSLVNLEKKLMKSPNFLTQISTEIELIKNQHFFAINHSNSVARLAALYKATLGNLSPTIVISGKQLYLSNQYTANHIRALLLAGIRAASLWKSQGGRAWQLFLNKKKTLKFINSINF